MVRNEIQFTVNKLGKECNNYVNYAIDRKNIFLEALYVYNNFYNSN